MTLQKLPFETLQKLQHHIKAALALPDSENHPQSQLFGDEEELPEPDSVSALGNLFNFGASLEASTYAPNTQGKWFISSTNPGSALLKLPGLWLRSDLRLVSYLYRVVEDGIGITWAVPESLSTTAQLENALAESGDRKQPPRPTGALAEVMQAMDGDRSPLSFVIASLLKRELQELGALGKSCDWEHHRLIATLPTQVNWQWRLQTPPRDLSTKVQILDTGNAAIEFFTCRVSPPIAIFQHIDHYQPSHYTPASLDRPIAVAVQR
jgi:hypothetical protein